VRNQRSATGEYGNGHSARGQNGTDTGEQQNRTQAFAEVDYLPR
jgi:hypothetical protein